MNIIYIIIGFFFFFLPNFTIIDILPDFIGCIFIIKGLSKLADLTPGLEEAKKSFLKVFYLHTVKFGLMFTVPFFGNTDGGYILIFSFCFAVLDMIFTLPAFQCLLNGFVYLGNRTNAKSVFRNQSEFSTLTSVFIIAKAFLAMVPDLSYISNPEYSGVVTAGGGFFISNYKNLLIGVNFIVTGILGLIWMYYTVVYFGGIIKDKELIDSLKKRYEEEILPNAGLFIRRNVKTAFSFISVGSLFMFDLLMDNVNVIPDMLGAVLFLIAAFILKKYSFSKKTVITSAVFFAASVAAWSILCRFAVVFPFVNIYSNMDAYETFTFVSIFNAVKYIAMAAFSYTLYKDLESIINVHTGSPVGELERIAMARREKQEEMKFSNKKVLVISLILCLSGILRTTLLYKVPFLGVIDFLVNLVYVIYLIKLLSTISEAVEYRYL